METWKVDGHWRTDPDGKRRWIKPHLAHRLPPRDEWPVHQPEADDAPIPGRHWYAGCEPGGDYDPELGNYRGTGPRVNPLTGKCESCGETACPECGRANCPDHTKEG